MHRHLVESVGDLYRRLHAGALGQSDLIDAGEVTTDDPSEFLVRIFEDPREFDAHFSAFTQTFDVFRVFGERETVLDVGAHWGYSAVAMRHQGCRARIVSIEATAFNVPALARLKQVPAANYDFVYAAASDRAGSLTFYLPVVNGHALTGLSSTGGTLTPFFARLVARGGERGPLRTGTTDPVVQLARLTVEARSIDDIVAAMDPPGSIAAIKMDVEGHEAPALRGAAHVFATERPLLMIEGGTHFQPVVDVMTSYGYVFAEREAGTLVVRTTPGRAGDGFWLHPDMIERYRALGLMNHMKETRHAA
jgi:FkbM family methyltransferase